MSRTATRALANDLPIGVVDVALAFIRGPLAEDPKRVGKPLRNELEGRWSARRGAYRIIYMIDDDAGVVSVVNVDHRGDIYRP